MNTFGLPSLAPFLEAPGDPAVPWRQWREDFEIFLQATEMDAKPPAQRKAILLQCLGVEGRRVFRTLVPEPAAAPPITAAATGSTPEKTTSKGGEPDDYTDALRLLERHFTNTLNVLVERRRFMLRRQLQEEPIRAYVSALRQLASTCDFGDFLEAALRDKVVDGVRSVELRQKLLMKGSQLTLGQAMDILQTFEQAAEGARVYEEGRDAAMVQQVERARNRSGTGVSGSSTVPDRRCYRCGASGHLASARECRARDRRCSRCHKVGHFQAVCRSTGQARVQAVQDTDGNEELGVLTVTQNERTTLIVDVCVEGEVIQLVVDTGSSVSILPANIYQEKFARRFALAPATVTLRDFSQQRIPVLGCFVAQAARGGVSSNIRFYVVSRGMALLGLDAVQQLRLHIDGASLACLQTTAGPQPLPPELSEFSFLFAGKLGLAKNVVHEVKLRPNVKPVSAKARRLPLMLREQVSAELLRLERESIIERVNASEWVSPIVVVKKKDGSIRLCVDLREPNKAIVVDGFPLPHTEELLHALNGAAWFSKLDLASAYHQVELSEDSRALTTFATHEGLFQFRRVCFGLASAPAAFQRMMEEILKGCKGVLLYIDDIIVFGKNKKEHNSHLREVLQRIAAAGLQLNTKCVFGVEELSFLGHHVSARGLAPLKSKVDAIINAQTPTDLVGLRSFLGLMGYYSHFLPHYAEVVEPLRRLLRKGQEFIWDQNAEESFGKAKNLLASCSAVSMFDRSLPVQVTTDASAYGLGAVLQQVIDGETRTIAFASRTLTPQERKYSTGEREALACLWACEHWHVYLWGRNFVLRTDHQALVTLLSTNGTGRRPLRIERWCARLMRYNFTVQYTKGEDNVVADALSRLPLLSTECDPVEEVIAVVSSVVTKNQLQVETEKDGVLREVMQYVTSSWPEKKCLSGKLLSFWRIQEELSVLEGVLFRAERVVPPSTLVSRFIMMAHESHPGIVRTKQRLREQYWWPGMDEDVENCIRSCAVCKASDKSAKTAVAPLQPVQWPEKPWEKLGMDIVGPMERAPPECRFAVTVIDYHSKWPEVFFVSSITSQSVTKVLLELFAREGYPKSVVTDNGRQFMSTQFEGFLQDRGIEHCVASLYYPQCNGQIERFNRVLKEYIQVAALERRPLKEAILEYLSIYRATPHATTGMSPAFLLHGRRPRTRLDVVGLPERGFFDEPRPHVAELQRRVKERQQRTKKYTDERRGARHSIIEPGDFVKIKRWGGPKGQQRFSLPIEVKKRVGKNSFLLDNGKKWNAAKLTVVAKGGAPGARNLVEKVMERRGAVRDQLCDLDLPTEEGASQLPSPRDVATARTPETLSPGDDSATVATHGAEAARGAETLPDATLQETEILSTPAESAPAPEQVEAQDISGQQELLTTAPSYSRPQRQRRMPGKYNDYVLH